MKPVEIAPNEVRTFTVDGRFSVRVENGNAIVIPHTTCFIDETVPPRFAHDACPDCTFLGHFLIESGAYDTYFCRQGSLPTVIARYGSEGHQYQSGLGFQTGPLPVVEDYARTLGLLPAREAPKK